MPVFKKILGSQRGGKILIDQEGYLYNYLRETGKGSTWACRAKYKLNCYTRVYYSSDSPTEHIEITVDHNHPPKLGEARTVELMRKLKSGTKNSYKLRRELIKELNDEDFEVEDQDLPTLLKKRKSQRFTRDRSRERTEESGAAPVTYETHAHEIQDMIVDVDTCAPDILSTCIQDSTTVDETGDPKSNPELQDALEHLLNEPELLQNLVNSLLGADCPGNEDQPVLVEDNVTESPPSTPSTSIAQTSQPLEPTEQPHLATATPPLPPVASVDQPEPLAGLVTALSPQFVTAVPVPALQGLPQFINSNQIVATVGQPSSTVISAGHLVRLPETIISNEMMYKRMNDACTLYIAPPALKNPYCRQCNTSFSSTHLLDQHFQSLKCCEMCKMAFCVEEHYLRHMELNHPDGKKSAWGTLCETCGRVFGVVFQLDSHRIKCSNRLSFRCPRCFYSFGFEEDLVRHKALHGSMMGVRCEDCDRTFPSTLGLQTHKTRRNANILTSSDSKYKGPFRCTICGKKFCLECDYIKHVNIHNHEVNITQSTAKPCNEQTICKFCTKTFSRPRDLLTHEASHMDINICKFCGLWCANQRELVKHERDKHVINQCHVTDEHVINQCHVTQDIRTISRGESEVNANNNDIVTNNNISNGVGGSVSKSEFNSFEYFNEMESLINSL